MAQDYHIYLHGVESLGDKTKPFSTRGEAVQSSDSNGSGGFQVAKQAFSVTKDVASNGAVSVGVAALAKVAPWVAAFIVALKITDKIVTTGFAHQEEYTGHYNNNVMYNNVKTAFNTMLHPISFVLHTVHKQHQVDKQNKEIAQQNKLIGNSILKDFNIGV